MCLPSSRILRNCDEGHKRLYHMGKLETPRYSNAIFWLCRSWCNLIIVINCNSCRIKITFFRWFKRFKICKDEPLNYTQNALFKGTKMNQTKLKSVCITKMHFMNIFVAFILTTTTECEKIFNRILLSSE